MTKRMWWLALVVPLLVAGLGYGALRYMTAVPGKPHRGELPPLTAEESALATALKRHIATIAERKERVVAMYSLETIGFYSSEPGSQHYPAPFGLMFPDRGDFVAFVGMLGSRALLQETIRSFRSHTSFPTIGGVAPSAVPGIGWSDHWAFAEHGFQAVMITDTALFRYPHYHRPTDTPDKIDPEKLARVVKGIERVIRDQTTGDGEQRTRER